MKLFLFFYLLLFSSISIKFSLSNVVSNFTRITKDLVSGIFVELKGQTWILPETCLNQEFEDDVNGFIKHLKKLQTVYCSVYLHKIAITDAFYNCPADQIIILYQDIKASVKSGEIYINSALNIKKIIGLIAESIHTKPLNAYELGMIFGKLINLTVYGKNQANFFNIVDHSYIKSNMNITKILNFLTDLEENKNLDQNLALIFNKLLEKYERSESSSIAKKILVLSLTSFELLQEFIHTQNLNQYLNIKNLDDTRLLNVIGFIFNMLKSL